SRRRKRILTFGSPRVVPLSPAKRLGLRVARLVRGALLKAGPRVRIRLPPAESLRTIGSTGFSRPRHPRPDRPHDGSGIISETATPGSCSCIAGAQIEILGSVA